MADMGKVRGRVMLKSAWKVLGVASSCAALLSKRAARVASKVVAALSALRAQGSVRRARAAYGHPSAQG
eukprot:CAMPEP_0119417626 /NCGR_PEP_ID=MMETSP1335-20130426/16290_1 /TAXON_ID=259385 /ORGANISM="Chrysoculter rhomboideus, Strain RCC1486" /LENGTH=68 /DNA_ID=CAMNT_0007442817 /DNA_START=893 /DNA_END=1100 /DNA_ORIENTATION=-